jgi:hypothetical protein
MGRIGFDESHRKRDASQFPKLKLDSNESARILVIEKEPWTEYVHTLRAPKIVNGEPVEETVEKDGTTTTSISLDFIGNPLCLGDSGILEDKGLDPANCPICALASEGDITDPPKRRFAANVLKYSTKPGTTELREPFSVEVVVWAFTDMVYGKLLDFKKEWDNLQEHDLLLGPCTNKMFQKFDMQVSKSAQWQETDERRAIAIETFKNNKADDDILKNMCGRSVKRSFMEEDIEKVKARWKIANDYRRRRPTASLEESSQSLDDSLDGLLTSQTGSADIPSADSSVEDIAEPKDSGADLGKPGSSGESLKIDDLDSLLEI